MRKHWFAECSICKHMDNFGKCTKSLWKPRGIYGVCHRYLETLWKDDKANE